MAIPLIFWLLAAEILAIPGLRFWESCGSRFCAAKVLWIRELNSLTKDFRDSIDL